MPTDLRAFPFFYLHDVRLGMPVGDLLRAKSLSAAAAGSYSENLAGFRVRYDFDSPDQEGRLQAITVVESFVTDLEASDRFERYLAETTRSLGITPECRFHRLSGARIAQYQVRKSVFVINYVPLRLHPDNTADAPTVTRTFRQEPSAEWAAASLVPCDRQR